MKFKSAIIATALLAGIAIASTAKATTIAGTLKFSGYANLGIVTFFGSSFASSNDFLGALTGVAQANSYNQIVNAFFGYANTNGGNLQESNFNGTYMAGTTSFWSNALTFTSATKTITYAGNTISGNTLSGQNTTITPVPGPEAGAGLGAVALGGVAFWMTSRRKAASVAA